MPLFFIISIAAGYKVCGIKTGHLNHVVTIRHLKHAVGIIRFIPDGYHHAEKNCAVHTRWLPSCGKKMCGSFHAVLSSQLSSCRLHHHSVNII